MLLRVRSIYAIIHTKCTMNLVLELTIEYKDIYLVHFSTSYHSNY